MKPKLTEEQVRDIRRLYSAGKLMQREIAQQYGISRSNVSLIVNRKAWSHVV